MTNPWLVASGGARRPVAQADQAISTNVWSPATNSLHVPLSMIPLDWLPPNPDSMIFALGTVCLRPNQWMDLTTFEDDGR